MPVLRDPHKSYSLVYPDHTPGDWVAWFINLHKGFPAIREITIKEGTTVGHQGRVWVPIFRRITAENGDNWDTDAYPFDTVIDKALDMGLGDFTKLVFRIHPRGHYLDYLYDNFDAVHTKEANITNHIVLEYNESAILDLIKSNLLKKTKRPYVNTVTPEQFQNSSTRDGYLKYKFKFEEKGVKVDIIDISKIILGDVYEYYRLCLLIDSPPLSNWKEIVHEQDNRLLEG